ncbi:MAG: alpha/beta hydrolase [Deltaproteobacteria bacterium]|nr:alpha/beta hydrolase [Deltaproteobacteria bacterium]
MKLRLVAALILTILISGCQGVAHSPTPRVMAKQMNVNGAQMAYVEQGTGDTVVFVHGALSDYRRWELIRPVISEHYRFVALSLRYHYPNPWTDKGEKYNMAQHVEDVAQFIRGLNAGKVHLVGHSYGGAIAGRIALKYPELLKTVVLGEGVLIPPTAAEGKAAGVEMFAGIGKAAVVERAGDDRTAAMIAINAIFNDPKLFQKLPLIGQQTLIDNAKMLPFLSDSVNNASPIACDQIGSLSVPALVITGQVTAPYFRYVNEALLNCLPKTTASVIIPAARHGFQGDNPGATAQALLAFLAQNN